MMEFSSQFLTRCARRFLCTPNANSEIADTATTFVFTPTEGGINNFVYYCDVRYASCACEKVNKPDDLATQICYHLEERLILRIYNNGGKLNRIAFEHKVLAALNSTPKLSFRVPEPLCVADEPAASYVNVDGQYVAMFRLIPGVSPEASHVYEFGLAAGELSRRLGEITSTILPTFDNATNSPEDTSKLMATLPTKPYYDLYGVHDAVDRERFVEAIDGNGFDNVREAASYLRDAVLALEDDVGRFQALQLPMQIIHGDLVYNNVLCEPESGKVTGLIDFEFASLDWRAMELAICLSKYAQESNGVQLFDDFVCGYSKFAGLSDAEILCIPALIALRLLSNVVYFIGRIISKEDSVHTLVSRMPGYVVRLQFLQTNSEAIVSICRHHFSCSATLE